MKAIQKTFFIVAATLATLTACQSQSNVITLTTPAPTSSFNTANQNAMVNVATRDLRTSSEVANYTKNGAVQRLTAVPDVTQLFQQVMQQNLNSKGFTLVSGAGNANVTVNVKTFKADVSQGNLRYKVTAYVSVDVVVQATRGTFSKNFNTSRSYEGAFGADNDEIQQVLNQAYNDAVQAIYNDNEIGNAINQYK